MVRPDPARQVAATAQAVSERYMPDVAIVERWSDGTFDPANPGDTGEGWTQVGDETVGRVDLFGSRASDRVVAEQHDIASPKVAVLPSGTDVAQEDRVTVGGQEIIVRAVQEATYDAHVRIMGEAP